jgi:mevalonate kinase
MTIASAPGKIILFGEHAVVYGRPALAVPVMQVCATVKAEGGADLGMGAWREAVWIEAPDINLRAHLTTLALTHPLRTTIENVTQFLGISAFPPVYIQINSTIPVASGLGSGAAVSVALIRALASFAQRPLSDAQVNALAYETEKIHHGTPSGIDNTVITYAKPVYFIKGQPIQTFSVARPFTLVIADTGISAPTKESVGDVRKLWEADKTRWAAVFDKVGAIVQQARDAIETGEIANLGPLMNANHALLQEMTVSDPKLDRLVRAAKESGALGAKLSGGGRGGNMLALVTPSDADKVSSALLSAGAKATLTTTIQ